MMKGHVQAREEEFKSSDFMNKMFGNKQTFTFKIFRPIANFSFSAIGLIYCLTNPSYLMLIALPLLLLGFFVSRGIGSNTSLERFNRGFTKVFLCFITFLLIFNQFIAFYVRLRLSKKPNMKVQSLESI